MSFRNRFKLALIWWVEKGVDHVESYMTPYTTLTILRWRTSPAQKEATYYTGVNKQNDHWTGSILKSSTYDLMYLHRFLQGYLVVFKMSSQAEVVTSLHRSITATSELTSAGCHLTRLASDLGPVCQKVHLYGTFVSGLCHLPPQMKNQHGLNEEKNLYWKKISHLSACDVTHVVSLNTNNQA